MPIRAIAYCSEASPHLPRPRLDALVDDAAGFNDGAGITGVLLYDGERFLQYLEGPEAAMTEAYRRILASRSHRNVIELARGQVGRRLFPWWSMRWLPAQADDLADAAIADWTGFIHSRTSAGQEATAVDRLLALVSPHLPPPSPLRP